MSEVERARFANIFATPLLLHGWDDGAELNAALLPTILSHAEANAGVAKTNVGGWHSDIGHIEFCGEAGRRLVRHMYEMGDHATRRVMSEHGQPSRPVRWTLQAWANVNREGEFNRMHTHPGATWSGTYYVDPGDPPPDAESGTPLHLFDPCEGRGNSFFPPLVSTHLLIRPEPGLMVLFPSYLPHMVYPHRGSRPRVSIAFNLRREPYP